MFRPFAAKPVGSRAATLFVSTCLLLLIIGLISCGGVTSSNPTPPGNNGASGGGTGGSGGGGGGTGGGSGGGGTGGGGGAPGTFVTFVYVVDEAPNIIEIYKVDPTSGTLTQSANPFQTGHTLGTLTVTPNHKFGYGVANDFTKNIFASVLLAYAFDPNTGAPSAIQTIQLGIGIGGSVTVDPSGKFAFVSIDSNNATGSGIAVYNIQNDGTLVQNGSIVPTDPNPGHIVVDSKGRFLYTDTASTNNIWGYAINSTTGTLTQIAGTPFTIQRSVPQAGKEPQDFNEVIDPSGQRLFVVDNINSRVNVFTIDQTSGAITLQGATTSTQFAELFAPALEPQGKFLYIGEFNTDEITGFNVSDATTPAFPPIPGLPVKTSGAPNRWMVIDPTGKFLYSIQVDAIGDPGNLDGYSIDQTTGLLTRLVSTPVRAQGSPVWIAITP